MVSEKSRFSLALQSGKKCLAVLIDPDQTKESVLNIIQLCNEYLVDFMFVGGSLITEGNLSETVSLIKQHFHGPVILFPGNELMLDDKADGLLLLSLISGRNPEYLIGKHVVAAPKLAKSKLEIVSTAYMLIDGGKETSVSYISNTKPIPSDKPDIAAATALAGKYIGMSCVYLDAGSGAQTAVSEKMVSKVKETTQLPLIIGGGIRKAETAHKLYSAGANVLVIGNGVEHNPDLIESIIEARNSVSNTVEV